MRHRVEALIEDLGYDELKKPVKKLLGGTKFNMPVLHYSQLMTLAYGGSAKDAGLGGNVIRARKLEEFASK